MLKKMGLFMTALMLVAITALFLMRPTVKSQTPLIQSQSQNGVINTQTIIANTELAALNIKQSA